MNGSDAGIRRVETKKVPLRLRLHSAKDVLFNAAENFLNNGDVNQAAAIALYAILSFIPLFILTLMVAGELFGSYPNLQQEVVEGMRKIHPFFSENLLKQLGQIENKKQVLGLVGVLSLVWFSAMIFSSIETAFNIIFRAEKARNYFVSKLLAIAMIPVGWIVGVSSVAISYLGNILAVKASYFGGGQIILPFVHGFLLGYVLPFVLTVIFFAAVYKIIPMAKVSWVQAVAGGVIFSGLMELAKQFFTWYVVNYTRYNVIYGSLEAVVILVIWVFYIALLLLFCAELISSYQRRDHILLEQALLKGKKNEQNVNERLYIKFGHIYPKGSYVFREGDTGQNMFYLLMGRVSVEKTAGQVKKVLAEMGPGAYFGEMAALIDVPRTASAQAVEDSDIAVIDGETFRLIMRESGEVSLSMLKEFSNRIIHTNNVLEELTQSWIKLVVILYFLKYWPFDECRDPIGELAKYTAKDQEDVRDVLGELAREGIVVYENGCINAFVKEKAWELLDRQVFA
ncbi:MAG: YhjD/YihY/BrkB family envelope integrity protein [Smithellaceae bacterium]|nr:YhjD/YihY/BrkB family envelope integrity protein [Smithellaceae bacterium]